MKEKRRWSDLLIQEHDRVLDESDVTRSNPWFQLGVHYCAAALKELAEHIRGNAYKAVESSLHFQILCDKNGVDPKKVSVALAQNAVAEFDREMHEIDVIVRREIPIRDLDQRSSANAFLKTIETDGDPVGVCDTLVVYIYQETADARNAFQLGVQLLAEWFVRGMNHYALFAEAREKTLSIRRQHDDESDASGERILDAMAQRVAGNWVLDRLSEIAALNPPSLVMDETEASPPLEKCTEIENFRKETKAAFTRELGLGPVAVPTKKKPYRL